MAVCSQIHTKHINTLCGQNGELLDVKPDSTQSKHWGFIEVSEEVSYLRYAGTPAEHGTLSLRGCRHLLSHKQLTPKDDNSIHRISPQSLATHTNTSPKVHQPQAQQRVPNKPGQLSF